LAVLVAVYLSWFPGLRSAEAQRTADPGEPAAAQRAAPPSTTGDAAPSVIAAPAERPGQGVVGGQPAAAGKWPDVAAIYLGDIPFCTGVLVAPTVVLTAAHCNTVGLTDVLIGAATLAEGNGGERIGIARRIEYPDWDSSFDVLVLVLERPSTRPPRALASGWAGIDVADGHEVQVVGFGAVDTEGEQFVDPLQEATTTITDATCLRAKGCNPDVQPGGELGAGGMGIDSCSGDSGGPLYVTGPLGTFVAGLTSRSYDNANLPCSEGGIYTRADRIADWIEEQAGVPIARGPEPEFAPIEITVGEGARTKISANDPFSKKHSFAVAAPPTRGSAAISADGTLRMCATGKGAGTDRVVVEVTDKTKPSRKILVWVPVTIADGVDDGGCELPDEGGCGCQGGKGHGAPAGVLGLLALLVLRRRRPGGRGGDRLAISASCHSPGETSKPPRGLCV
jgi:MYXO-CTERM domain-containing protein